MRLGFIGYGNMATAIIKGILANGKVKASDIIVSDAIKDQLEKAKELGVSTTLHNCEVVSESDVIFFAVKPQYMASVIEEIKEVVTSDKLIVSIVAGKTIDWYENRFGKEIKLVRTMPNTPALVGEGMTAACKNKNVTDDELNKTVELLSCFGKVQVVGENLMDVVVAVSGSSPAYVFMFIEAMADAAVADGMPRAQAYEFAAQSVMGSAKLMLETNLHPGVLKDMVCSPGGTTIEAVRVLEEKGLRSCVIEAMKACANKSRQL